MNALIYQPGDLGYRLPNPFSNPYEKRCLPAPVSYSPLAEGQGAGRGLGNGISGPKCHRLREKVYQFFFHNHNSLYHSHRRVLRLNPNPKVKREFLWASGLPGNPARTSFLLRRYLQFFVKRCQLDPTRFAELATQINEACHDLQIEIPSVRAFAGIEHLEDLLKLLQSLMQKQGAFQFELAVAAILQFAGLRSLE